MNLSHLIFSLKTKEFYLKQAQENDRRTLLIKKLNLLKSYIWNNWMGKRNGKIFNPLVVTVN